MSEISEARDSGQIILDASALLVMLKEEPGGAKVAEVLAGARISAVNFAEVISHFVRLGMPAYEVDSMLKPLPLTIIEADVQLARVAGRLCAVTAPAGLSLGDRFCPALAWRVKRPAWTADKRWRMISDAVGVNVVVIRER